jgi:tetraacyldisaccharide 4'-kinase
VAGAGPLERTLTRAWWRRRRGWLAWLLLPFSCCFAAASASRRLAYAAGWLQAQRAPVPVIVVGNLVAGGAGKTPTVIALVDALRRAGHVPGIISRGHGRQGTDAAPVHDDSPATQVGDEPLLIRLRTRAPVWVARRRIAAARALCAVHPEVDVLVADDGLQHLALRRDVQVIVFDERGVGNGLLLPAGPLRQPLAAHVPVNSHVLYNAPSPSTPWPGALAQRRLAGAVLLQDWWSGAPATAQALQQLRGRPLLAAAGMAAPQRFFGMLRDAGLTVTPLPLADHAALDAAPWRSGTPEVVCTEKDAAKLVALPADALGTTRVWVVGLDFQLPEDFVDTLQRRLHAARRQGPGHDRPPPTSRP